MGCPRCHGFMVIDTCLNREGGFNSVWVYELRCLNCGEIFDAQTLANRRGFQHKTKLGQAQEVI